MIWLGARQQVAAMPMRLALAWPSPAFICFVLGLLGALSMAVLTPPFQVPDESQHFHRAFQLSELEFHSMVRDGAAGAVLPSSLPELTETFLGTRAIHASRPITDQKLTRTAGLLSMPLSPDRREFVDFTGSAFYSPLPYVPQALAIAAGRLAGAGPLELLYLARIANALVAVSVLALAVGLLPLGREVAMVGGLLPMAIFEYGSVSPDAGVICTAFLFTALMTRGVTRGAWTAGEVAGATLCGLVFCSLKPVYAPLILLGLPLALDRGRVKHVLFVHALLIGTDPRRHYRLDSNRAPVDRAYARGERIGADWVYRNTSVSLCERDRSLPVAHEVVLLSKRGRVVGLAQTRASSDRLYAPGLGAVARRGRPARGRTTIASARDLLELGASGRKRPPYDDHLLSVLDYGRRMEGGRHPRTLLHSPSRAGRGNGLLGCEAGGFRGMVSDGLGCCQLGGRGRVTDRGHRYCPRIRRIRLIAFAPRDEPGGPSHPLSSWLAPLRRLRTSIED